MFRNEIETPAQQSDGIHGDREAVRNVGAVARP